MRALPFPDARFDAAVNLFTSFGYLGSEDADAGVLREIGRVLRPGGRFLLDTIHRDAVAHRFLRQDWETLPGGGYLMRERVWNARTGRIEETWIFHHNGEARRFTSSVRLYTCPEIERMLGAADLEVNDVWGDWEGGPLLLGSSRLLVRATRRNG